MRKNSNKVTNLSFADCLDVSAVKKWCSRLTAKDCASVESFLHAIANYQKCNKNVSDDCDSTKD